LLRGINNVGSRRVTMAVLKSAFEAMGHQNVRTVLASGNVIFEASRGDSDLDRTIRLGLGKTLGFPVAILTRTVPELKAIIASDPFRSVPSGPDVQQYVTFLDRNRSARGPVRPPEPPKGVLMVKVDPGEVYSVVMLSQGGRTPDLMHYLDRTFGPQGTTRNWRTVIKLAGGGK
jgi:uncharacterized protein (DUF1697 family)